MNPFQQRTKDIADNIAIMTGVSQEIVKGISEDQFTSDYIEKGFLVINEVGMLQFQNDLAKAIDSNPEKKEEILEKAKRDMSGLKQVVVNYTKGGKSFQRKQWVKQGEEPKKEAGTKETELNSHTDVLKHHGLKQSENRESTGGAGYLAANKGDFVKHHDKYSVIYDHDKKELIHHGEKNDGGEEKVVKVKDHKDLHDKLSDIHKEHTGEGKKEKEDNVGGIIGHTKSGKPIYEQKDTDHYQSLENKFHKKLKYTKEDHQDAVDLHNKLSDEATDEATAKKHSMSAQYHYGRTIDRK